MTFHRVHAGGGTNLHLVYVCPMLWQPAQKFGVDANLFAVADGTSSTPLPTEEVPSEGPMDGTTRGVVIDENQNSREVGSIPPPPLTKESPKQKNIEEDKDPEEDEDDEKQEEQADGQESPMPPLEASPALGLYKGQKIMSTQAGWAKDEEGKNRPCIWIEVSNGWFTEWASEGKVIKGEAEPS